MAVKGERAQIEPLAMRLYAEGHTLTEISSRLSVSDTSLRKWKEESRIPGEEQDGWDKARMQKRGNIQRLKDLFERQLEYVEGLLPSEVSAPMMDTLSKLGALVERWDKVEKTQAVASEVANQVKKAGLSDEAADDIRRRILGIGE